MTKLSEDEVRRLAALSSLSLTDDEIDELKVDLPAIINFIDKIGELDTEGVAPTYQVTELENVWRDDEVQTDGVTPEQLVNLSANHENGQIRVPKVL